MNFSLDSLVDNLSEIKNKSCIRCKERNKTFQPCEFFKLDGNRLMYKRWECQDVCYKPLQPLTDKFANTYRLGNNDNQKFELLLRKGVYPYEYIDDWKGFKETELPSKEDFYSNLRLESIKDKEYQHKKNVTSTFKIKNL